MLHSQVHILGKYTDVESMGLGKAIFLSYNLLGMLLLVITVILCNKMGPWARNLDFFSSWGSRRASRLLSLISSKINAVDDFTALALFRPLKLYV